MNATSTVPPTGLKALASAPGKLMLAGEYVVAERGTVALAVAVGRRVVVEATASPHGEWLVTSEDIGLLDDPIHRVPVLASALARLPDAARGGRLVIRSALGSGPEKPGLGGSAAICVAGAAALARASGLARPTLQALIDAHRAAQDGLGSGYDVAASLEGGVTVFTPYGPDGLPRVVPASWPTGLLAGVFQARRGASTPNMLRRVAAWRDDDPETLDACLEPLAIETEDLVQAFLAGDLSRILAAAAQVQEELVAFDRIGELGIMGSGQLQLHGAIEDAGCVGRTAGAGGGDCVWALTDDPEALARATASAQELGFRRLDLSFPEPGLRDEKDEAAG